MRIISGTHKGRRLSAPKSLPVRPTTDFAKEGLFNILRNRLDLHEITVLDLFSGTGNISFEFASRAVPEITSVDKHYECIKYINKIAEEFEFPIQTIKADVLKYLDTTKSKFDLIFADPPYNFDSQSLENMSSKIFDKSLLKEDGLLIIEHAKDTDVSQIPHYEESRRYGGSVFSFFR